MIHRARGEEVSQARLFRLQLGKIIFGESAVDMGLYGAQQASNDRQTMLSESAFYIEKIPPKIFSYLRYSFWQVVPWLDSFLGKAIH